MKNRVAVIFPTDQCNMTCSFCVTEDSVDVMSQEQADFLLTKLHNEDIKTVVIGGGEPFCWPYDISKLTAKARSMGFFVQVGTNGLCLPEDIQQLNSIDRLVIPLESTRAEIHDQMRFCRQGHHQVIMNCLERIKKARKSVTISTVVTQVNLHELTDLAHFLRKYNEETEHIHAWHIYKFLPLGRGGSQNVSQLEVSEAEFLQAFKMAKSVKQKFKVFKRVNMYEPQSVRFHWFEQGKLKMRGVK